MKKIIIIFFLLIVLLLTVKIVKLKKFYDNFSVSFSLAGLNLSKLISGKSLRLKLFMSINNPVSTSIVLRKFKLKVYYDNKMIAETIDNEYTENFSILKSKTTNYYFDIDIFVNLQIAKLIKDVVLDNKTVDIEYSSSFLILGIIPYTYKGKYTISKSHFVS